jgi:arylsulfatase A-like enzyme
MPRLEQLAAEGIRFTDAYVSGGVCHPSRCGLLTGGYQQRFGVDNNLSGPSYNGYAASQRTVPRRLQGLGYRTYGIAKWHLGTTVDYHPLQRGFDRWYGIYSGSRSYWNASGESNIFQDNETPRPQDEGDYVTDRIGNACTNFIAEHLAAHGTNQPFFIYVAFTAVHGPVDIDTPPAPKPTDPRYARLLNEFGLEYDDYGPPEVVFSGSTAATTQKNRYDLAAMTLALDENIGKIVDMIDASGLGDNTLIVYLNDNGGAGWSSGFGGNYSYNLPLRGYKGGSMTEGSIRIPAVARWPGMIPVGQTNATPVISLDFMATFVNAGGDAPVAARNGLEGLDLLPLMRDGTPLPEDRVLCWRAGDVDSGGSAARMGDWKIRKDNGPGSFRLYDLASDIHEDTDVSGANPAIFNELNQRFNAWDARNIEPLYGGSDMIVDSNLERFGVTSGYRVQNRSGSDAFLSASLREGFATGSDFALGFYLRPAETNHGSGERLWFVLGDDTTRANFIRAGVDFENGLLRLEEGRTGGTASAPLPGLPEDWTAGVLTFDSGTGKLGLSLGGTNISVVLPGSYGTLDVYGCGAAQMEGEVTRPFVLDVPPEPVNSTNLRVNASSFAFNARYTGDAVFGPTLARALLASGPYALDDEALVENLGGGLYRVTTRTQSGQQTEFFRVGFNQP